ncbi:MAG TPA: hypothetical protein VL728_07720 [Cyclobacteriaceae bacterium]|nr:hypothetical protein [Cyclobacteriaceae bacterium]
MRISLGVIISFAIVATAGMAVGRLLTPAKGIRDDVKREAGSWSRKMGQGEEPSWGNEANDKYGDRKSLTEFLHRGVPLFITC